MDWHPRFHRLALEGMRHLTLEQRGAYQTCLDLMYDRGGPIPDDDRWLAGHMNCSVRAWKIIRSDLIEDGKLVASGEGKTARLSNQRVTEELAIQNSRRKTNAENGARGGKSSAEKKTNLIKNNDEGEAVAQAGLKLKTETVTKTEEVSSLRSDSSSGCGVDLFGGDTASSGKADEAQSAFDAYNALASELGLKIARKLDPARRKKIAATLKIHGADGWSEALDRIRRSRFLRGEASDFSASLNFMLQPSSFTKIIEGEYEKDRTNGNGTHHGEPAWKAQRVEDYSEFGAAGIAALGLRNGRSGGG